MVDKEAFMREMGLDAETVGTLYDFFTDELRADIGQMAENVKNRDKAAFAHIVHKIKGTSASYKARELMELTKSTDNFCKQENWVEAFEMADKVLAAARDVLKELART